MDNLADRVKRLRGDAGITQTELAILASISRRTVARIEAGWTGANRSTIRLLAQALGVTPEELLDDNGEEAA